MMRVRRFSRTRSRPRGLRPGDGHRPHRLANGANAVEPGVAGEIVGPRQCHRRRRRQPGAKANLGAWRDPGGNLSSSIEMRTCGGSDESCRMDQQPDLVPRSEMFDRLYAARESATTARSSRGWATQPARPDQCAAQGRGKREPAERPARPAGAQTESRDRDRCRNAQEQHAIAALTRARTRPRCRFRSRRRTRAEAGRAPPREASPAPREPRKTAPSNSPEHAVEEALPLC